MFTATIRFNYVSPIVFGPTDSRDEASRLARSWIEASPARSDTRAHAGNIVGVEIAQVPAEGGDDE